MRMIPATAVLSLILIAGPAQVRGDGMPSPELSTVSWELGAGQSAILLVVPDGDGPAFTAARDANGAEVDATIRLVLRDGSGFPIAMFPAEDMWIESADQGLVFCAGGGSADHWTDALGSTTWSLPRRAGGHSQTSCRVFVNGLPVTGGINPELHFNSPDINGDLYVNLLDVAAFTRDYYGAYEFRSDLARDAVLNLADVAVMVAYIHIGAGCP